MSDGWYRDGGKRVVDIALSGAALVVLSPIMAMVAVAIRLDSRGPAVFRQVRSGRGGASFTVLKFRSMAVDSANVPSAAAGTLSVTRVGRFIRRTNLDELPQLVNVLRGDMSIVGPRPALPSQGALLSMRNQNGASGVRPGLTGLAQIRSYDGMPEDLKARFDGDYSRAISLASDLSIILGTFGYLLRRPPVY